MQEPSLPWLSQKTWALQRWGQPLYRVPLDPGWGCPNRRRDGSGGCSFCAEDGSRARQLGDAEGLEEQLQRGLHFVRERYGPGLLQLYVQAYTATYTSPARLQETFTPLLEQADIHSLSLGTRPDCLPEATLRVLQQWNRERELWVELGLQTCHERSLARIQRGHGWQSSVDAVKRLQDAGIRVCAHLLFGLPGEAADEMLESVQRVVALKVDALKLHLLHVLKGSPMGRQWQRQAFPLMSEEDYLGLLLQLLPRIPADLPLFRISTDSDPALRLAPPQRFAKGQFLRELELRMLRKGLSQGCLIPAVPSG